jgi:hypothetical protein
MQQRHDLMDLKDLIIIKMAGGGGVKESLEKS